MSYGPYEYCVPCFSGSTLDVRPSVVVYSGTSVDGNLTFVFCLTVLYADGAYAEKS